MPTSTLLVTRRCEDLLAALAPPPATGLLAPTLALATATAAALACTQPANPVTIVHLLRDIARSLGHCGVPDFDGPMGTVAAAVGLAAGIDAASLRLGCTAALARLEEAGCTPIGLDGAGAVLVADLLSVRAEALREAVRALRTTHPWTAGTACLGLTALLAAGPEPAHAQAQVADACYAHLHLEGIAAGTPLLAASILLARAPFSHHLALERFREAADATAAAALWPMTPVALALLAASPGAPTTHVRRLHEVMRCGLLPAERWVVEHPVRQFLAAVVARQEADPPLARDEIAGVIAGIGATAALAG